MSEYPMAKQYADSTSVAALEMSKDQTAAGVKMLEDLKTLQSGTWTAVTGDVVQLSAGLT